MAQYSTILSSNFYAFSFEELDGTPISATASTVVLGFEGGLFDVWNGSFIYNALGFLSGGTITSYRMTDLTVNYSELTGLSYSVSRLVEFVNANDSLGFLTDVLIGQDGISGSNEADTIAGFLGSDTVNGNGGNDVLLGGRAITDPSDGADTLYGGAGSDTLYGNAGNDILFGGIGEADPNDAADLIFAGIGTDTVYGNGGDDTLAGSANGDLLLGGGGNDLLYGGNGVADPVDEADTLYGHSGQDTIYGNAGSDLIFGDGETEDGSAFADVIYGGIGADTITGGGGNDLLFGNSENDLLIGGTGNDTLTGGTGADIFWFASSNGLDRITDFTLGEDIIRLNSGLNGQAITDFSSLTGRISQSTEGALIDLGAGHTLLLAGIEAGSLSAANFAFMS